MKFLRIYKNDELLMSGSSIEKYEEQSTVSGVYPLNGLIVTNLGEESEMSTKFLSEVNFTLAKEHKAELAKKFKIY